MHCERKRQSSQTTHTVPAPSTAAVGSGPLRRPAASVWVWICAIATGTDQLVPPLVELNADMKLVSIGTTTVHCSATDNAGNSSGASFTVHVNSAAEQLGILLTAVEKVGPGTALANDVKQVQGYVAAHDKSHACAGLTGFIDLVASQKGKKLTVAQATSFTAQANSIRATLGC